MKIEIDQIVSQIYILPFIKLTTDLWLNGRYELIIGWFNRCITISYEPK